MLRILLGLTAALSWGVAIAGAVPATGLSGADADLARRALQCNELLLIRQQPVMPSHVYTYHVEGLRPGGGLYRDRLPQGGSPAALTQLVDCSAGVILDCELSFDAKTVLFSWKKSMQEPFHLFTIPVAGGRPRRLTSGDHHNFNACWLPDGGIAFLSTRNPQFAYCWNSPVGVLHRMNADGGDVRRLSANYLNDFTPAVMEDGRIIYGRWEYVDRPAIPIQKLWTIHPDGTMLSGYFGNRVLGPATFIEARAIPGGSGRVLCTMTGHNGRCSGAIGIIDPKKGGNAQAAIANLTPEVDIGKVTISTNGPASGPYQSPWPLDNHCFLVTHYPQANRFADGAVQLRSYDGKLKLELLPGQGELTWVCAQPIRARPRPPLISTTLPPSPPPDVRGAAWATIAMQDVYQGLEPRAAPRRGRPHRRRAGDRQTGPRGPGSAGVRLPVSRGLVRGHLRAEEDLGVRRRGGRRLRALPGAGQRADLFPRPRPARPRRAAHADLHASDAGRNARLRRLPRGSQLRDLFRGGFGGVKTGKSPRASALGSAESRLRLDRSARPGQALRAVPQPPRSAQRPRPVRRPHRLLQCFL